MQDADGKMIRNLVTEYEEVIHSMQIQLETTKEEHKNLKEEIFQLVSENQNLRSKLDAEYKQKIKDSLHGNLPDVFESELVKNLQNQLDLCKREKEKMVRLYESSLKVIEKLEGEIADYKDKQLDDGRGGKIVEVIPGKGVLEAKLRTVKEHLEVAMTGREQLESENVKYQTEIAKLRINLDSNNKLIDQMKAKEDEWKNKFTKLEQNYTLLNATFECVAQTRNDLEKTLEAYSRKIQDLVEKNNESKSKVEEALDVVDKAFAERNASAAREIQLNEEIRKLHLCLEHVIEEAGKKVGTEVEETKKKYDSTVKDLTKELSDVKTELEKKKEEHKKISLKYKKLERVASAKLDKEKITLIKGSETEMTILESHLDSVYQELERLKIKHEELLKGKKKIEREFEELFENRESLIKDKESREAYFDEVVNDLKSQMEEKVESLNEATKRMEFFLDQVRELQTENKKLVKIVDKCNCDKLKSKIVKLKEMRHLQMTELEAQVESQMKLNDAWKIQMKEITEKFEERIKELKKECAGLKAKNRRIMVELNDARKKILSLENARR